MKVEVYSHFQGEQIVDPKIKKELIATLQQLNFAITKGCADKLRKAILAQLNVAGWSNKYKLNTDSQISLTSNLNDHVLCLQTGNMGRFYADLLKMQYVFTNNTAKAAFYILPSKEAAENMGDNIANFDRFKKELNLFNKIITIPTLVLGIN